MQERLNAHTLQKAQQYLEGELEQRLPEIYEQKYAPLWAEEGMYIPAASSLEEGTTEIKEELFEAVGKAAQTDLFSGDIPVVQTSINEETYQVHMFALAYAYNIIGLARDAKAGRPLNMKRVLYVDRGLRQATHELILFGNKKRGTTGLYNNASVPVATTTYNPNTATWQQHLDFFTEKLTDVMVNNFLSAGTDYVLTSYRHIQKLKTTYQSADSGLSAYEAIMKTNDIKGLIGVNESSAPLLERFGIQAAGTDFDRMIFMPEDANVISHARFAPNFLEPERRELNYKVVAYSGCSELIITAPTEMLYVPIPSVVS